jgi:hypothetical protein
MSSESHSDRRFRFRVDMLWRMSKQKEVLDLLAFKFILFFAYLIGVLWSAWIEIVLERFVSVFIDVEGLVSKVSVGVRSRGYPG